mmetsp:Transcript_2795/g.3885  ORF Transcript_2795/g.3885 Transcript_2795/m.3885 type:complete len:270 (-) Transcript_2795:1951-2760(-)
MANIQWSQVGGPQQLFLLREVQVLLIQGLGGRQAGQGHPQLQPRPVGVFAATIPARGRGGGWRGGRPWHLDLLLLGLDAGLLGLSVGPALPLPSPRALLRVLPSHRAAPLGTGSVLPGGGQGLERLYRATVLGPQHRHVTLRTELQIPHGTAPVQQGRTALFVGQRGLQGVPAAGALREQGHVHGHLRGPPQVPDPHAQPEHLDRQLQRRADLLLQATILQNRWRHHDVEERLVAMAVRPVGGGVQGGSAAVHQQAMGSLGQVEGGGTG